MRSLAEIAFSVLIATQDAAPFEGATVIEVPLNPAALKTGDILLSIEGRKETSTAAIRHRIAGCLGRPVTVRVLRNSEEVALEWTPAIGTYRLTDWPGPAEQFRRDHAGAAAEASIQAGIRGIQAALEGNGRTALRLLAKSREGGGTEPILDWAEGYVKARYQDQPAEAATLLARALAAAEKRDGPDGKRIAGWCHVASAYRIYLHKRESKGAIQEISAARECGVDVTEVSRAVAAWLPRGDQEAQGLRRQVFQDDPLDAATARWLAESASTGEESRKYSDALQRLTGEAGSDPRLELTGLLLQLKTDPKVAGAVESFVREHSNLPEADLALAWDGLADFHGREQEPARELARRIDAIKSSPTTDRARALDRAAKRSGTFAAALEAIRSVLSARLSKTSEREYFAIYGGLLQEAYLKEGVPILEESIRLQRLGHPEEAVDFLSERADALLQPELRVAAGLMLRESGETGDLSSYFLPEATYWTKASDSDHGWSDTLRVCLLQARAQYSGDFDLDRLEELPRKSSWEQQSTYQAVRSAILYNAGKKEEARNALRDALQALDRPGANKAWVPIYAEGRLCREPRDYIESLNEKWKAGLSVPPTHR